MKEPTWLLLLYGLPTRRNAERVSLWRKLKKFGAIQLKTSGYLLPDSPTHYERFQWLSRQIRDAGGDATLMRLTEFDGLSSAEIMAMFNDARDADYKELAATCRATLSRYTKGRANELPHELDKLQRRFQEIRAIDYFSSPAVHDAEIVLKQAEKALAPQKAGGIVRKLDARQFVGKVWLTRPRPGIDRCGSAWLIRKLIDPKARFVFGVDPTKNSRAIPFDLSEVEFSHHGEDCTFETLVKRFGIRDKSVLKMAEMVHDADLEDGKFQRCECIGINSVLSGWATASISDAALLAKGIECFEGLYEHLR